MLRTKHESSLLRGASRRVSDRPPRRLLPNYVHLIVAPRDADGLPRWHRLDLDAASDATDEKKKRLAPGRKSLADMLEAESSGQSGA